MPAAICPRTKHETIPCILGENRSIRQLSMESLPARIRHCHPRATLARVFVAPPPQPPNGRRIVDSIVRNENRAFTWNKVFRCVSLRFSVRETAKGRFANCGGTVLRWEGEFHFRWYSFRSTRSSFRCCLRAPPPTIPLRDKGILLTDKFV